MEFIRIRFIYVEAKIEKSPNGSLFFMILGQISRSVLGNILLPHRVSIFFIPVKGSQTIENK
jgi:hypothetical protein